MDTSSLSQTSLMAYATGISSDRLNRAWREAQDANAAAVARRRPASAFQVVLKHIRLAEALDTAEKLKDDKGDSNPGTLITTRPMAPPAWLSVNE